LGPLDLVLVADRNHDPGAFRSMTERGQDEPAVDRRQVQVQKHRIEPHSVEQFQRGLTVGDDGLYDIPHVDAFLYCQQARNHRRPLDP
jgi:hypothetical protein